MSAQTSDYGAESIKVLEGLEGVRKRPAMYIGSTGKDGLHHLIYEVVDNSVDEALAGHCSLIKVTINKDGSATIEDDGRGIPVNPHPKLKIPAVQVALTKLHAGGGILIPLIKPAKVDIGIVFTDLTVPTSP